MTILFLEQVIDSGLGSGLARTRLWTGNRTLVRTVPTCTYYVANRDLRREAGFTARRVVEESVTLV